SVTPSTTASPSKAEADFTKKRKSSSGMTVSTAVITTVDTVMPDDDFLFFVKSASAFEGDAVVLGVTDCVDDENPLWVTLDPSDGRIRRIGGSDGTHVTAGLYWLPAQRPAGPSKDFARLRDYLGWLVAGNQPIYGV